MDGKQEINLQWPYRDIQFKCACREGLLASCDNSQAATQLSSQLVNYNQVNSSSIKSYILIRPAIHERYQLAIWSAVPITACLMATKRMSLISNSNHWTIYSYLQIINRCKNRCVHTVSTQQLSDYRELLKRFLPRSYQVAILIATYINIP